MQLGEATYGDICMEGCDLIAGCESAVEGLQSRYLRSTLIASEPECCSLLYSGLAHGQLSLTVA